ncbi:unnamed protein product [Hymenolepis diminuta]|uniref:BTB domain-containing protein n=1 Tax=Hymenolepis diminuta TaxID=6216 RepID=A0A564Y6M6_HYMDI|nr:unnamed protein product [Hymenolepis diminuta]
MINENEITYKISDDGLEECEIYDFLRQKKKFFDLKVLTRENTIPVHRVVLSRRFKHLIQVLPDSADSFVDWSRFPHEINVDNVVDIWVVANVTVNEDLISSCLTAIRGHIDDLIDDSRFFVYTEPKGMAMMICDESILSEVGSSSENHETLKSCAIGDGRSIGEACLECDANVEDDFLTWDVCT